MSLTLSFVTSTEKSSDFVARPSLAPKLRDLAARFVFSQGGNQRKKYTILLSKEEDTCQAKEYRAHYQRWIKAHKAAMSCEIINEITAEDKQRRIPFVELSSSSSEEEDLRVQIIGGGRRIIRVVSRK